MKILLLFLISVCVSVNAQQKKQCEAGIYNTSDDLIKNKVAHKIRTGEKDSKLKFEFPADLKLSIKIVKPDTTLVFKPGTVFGFTECGYKFRYYKGGDLDAQEDFYRVEEMGGLVIYTSAFVSGSETFYSRTIDSPIHRLILKHIEKDFTGDTAFVNEVRKLNNEQLHGELALKNKNGKYRINELYAQKIKQ